ncbi:MAG: DUF4349 domain-containing protein [Chloroflexota bacterium]
MKKLVNVLKSCFNRAGLWLMLIVLAGLTAACGAQRAAVPAPTNAAEYRSDQTIINAEAMPAEPATGYVDGSSAVDDILDKAAAQPQGPRVIIYTGDMALVVKDTRAAVNDIAVLAGEQGGYVSASNIYQAGEVPRGSVTIRIPAETYQDTLTKLRALAVRVERENTNTQDVTEEYTDLEARKTNLEFTEAALQQLLEERQRVGSTSDILEVYRELTNIRGQIEQIEGRMRYLANQSALSTITIELIPDVLYQPVSVAGWKPQGVAKEALQALVVALQGLVNLTIWLVIFVLPLLIIALIPVVVVIWLIRWGWKRSRAGKKATEPVKPEEKKTS